MGGLEGIDKRVGSRGKKKKERESDPPIAVGGLEGIDKSVGSWGKKKEKCWCKSKKKSVGSWGKKSKRPTHCSG